MSAATGSRRIHAFTYQIFDRRSGPAPADTLYPYFLIYELAGHVFCGGGTETSTASVKVGCGSVMATDSRGKAAEQDLVLFREVFRESQERRQLNVLVGEDDDEDFMILKRHLEDMEDFDARISRATTLHAAMDMAETSQFQLALVDYWLGADTGPRVLEGLGGRHGALPTVLVTGLGHDAYKKAAMKAGAIHCLSKDDINTTVLQDTIRSVLHTHELESKLRTSEG